MKEENDLRIFVIWLHSRMDMGIGNLNHRGLLVFLCSGVRGRMILLARCCRMQVGSPWLAIALGLACQLSLLFSDTAWAVAPYHIRTADPVSESWRVSRYPELQGRGLRCLAEDQAGNMWFGVNDGVVRYDGLNWKHYGADRGLTGGAVESLVVRDDGVIVAATKRRILQMQGGQWVETFPEASQMPCEIRRIAKTSGDVLWACCDWGLLRLQAGKSTLFTSSGFHTVAKQRSCFDSILEIPSSCLPRTRFCQGTGIAHEGRIVTLLGETSPARAGGLRVGDSILQVQGRSSYLFESLQQPAGNQMTLEVERFESGKRETVTFTTTETNEKYRDPSVHSVLEDRQGRIWVGATEGRLLMTEDAGRNWRTWGKDEGLEVGGRPAAIETLEGEIWVVSADRNNGLCRFDGSKWTSKKLSMLNGVRYDSAAAQTVDGTIWISGLNRLHVWRDGQWKTHDTRDLGIPGESHRMLVAADDSLWIAGFGQYPVRIAMSPDEVWSLEGLQYQCTEASGARWFIESDTDRIVRHDGSAATSHGADDGAINSPAAIATVPGVGVIAIGSHNEIAAISTYDGSTWVRKEFPEVALRLSGAGFAVARDGRIWIAARGDRDDHQVGGVIVGIGDQWQHQKPPGAPVFATAIMELADGRMMKAGGFGASIFDGAVWTRLADPLLSETTCPRGTIDDEGTVWLATRMRGVLRYRENQWTAFTTDNGLLANDVSTICADRIGTVWASTSEGLCRFDGERFHRVKLPGRFGRKSIQREDHRSGVWLDGARYFAPDEIPPTAVLDQDSMEVEPGSNALVTWHGVDAWNRTSADQLTWSTRIDGGPWSPYRKAAQLLLDDLASGKHTVEVRSRDDDFNQSSISRATSILVLPPVWMRPWFLVPAAILLVVVIWQSASLIRSGIALRASHEQLKRARSQLADRFAEKTAQFRAVCDCSPVGIFVADTEGRTTYFNQHLAQITGISAADAKNGWIAAIHPDDRDRVLRKWKDSLRAGKAYRDSGRFLPNEGKPCWFEVVADRVESDGQLLGYVGAVEDITDRVNASEELKESNSKLRLTLNQLKEAQDQAIKRERLGALGQMAAGVAHDVNNSLTPLLTYAELLAGESGIEGQSREWVELIRLGVSDTAGIVKRLEHFYRESHNREFLKSIRLDEVVTQAVELTRPKWQNAALADGKMIQVRVETDSSPVVDGDPSQIRAVITNLIFNAIDAIEDRGTVSIRVAEDSSHAVLEVVDDGSGMTSEQLDRCLEPFYTTKPKGSGLGLSECHGVVRQHGGSIGIESQRKQGTEVRVLLPLATAQADDSDQVRTRDSDEPDTIRRDREIVDARRVNSKVLYIDDDPTVRRSTAALFRSLRIPVETAADGPAGLQLLEKSNFRLVMCDQGMPGMDGITVLKEIKRRRPDMPVVIVSGWSLPDGRDGVQPDGFLEKPVAYEDLIAVLQQFLHTANVA